MEENESLLSDSANAAGTPSDSVKNDDADLSAALERSLNATADYQNGSRCGKPPAHLIRLAEKYKGCELSLSPILLALVSAANEDIQLPGSSIRQEMNLAVAETIFNDSTSRQRMEKFWHRLQQERFP